MSDDFNSIGEVYACKKCESYPITTNGGYPMDCPYCEEELNSDDSEFCGDIESELLSFDTSLRDARSEIFQLKAKLAHVESELSIADKNVLGEDIDGRVVLSYMLRARQRIKERKEFNEHN